MDALKKIYAAGLLIVSIVLSGCIGMKETSTHREIKQTEDGWVDDDTFRVTARGTPVSLEQDIEGRKRSSERAAILNARFKVLETFKRSGQKDTSGIEEFEVTGAAVARELKARIQDGKVVQVRWDEKQNCEVVYEVFAPGLRKKVAAAEWKDE